MAKNNNKTFVPQPPIHAPISDLNRGGRVTQPWLSYFDAERRRSGGTYATSQRDLEDSNIGNAETIEEVKVSIGVLETNIEHINAEKEEIQKQIRKIINDQGIDHESIVSAGSKLEELTTEISTIKENIATINEDIKTLKDDNGKVEVVDQLPSDSKYNNKFVIFKSELYINIGGTFKKLSFAV